MADDRATSMSYATLQDPLLSGNHKLAMICRGDTRLARGACGNAVLRLQEALARLGHVSPPTHGRFDRALEAALIRFQESHERPGDGILDSASLLELDTALRTVPTPTQEFDVLRRAEHDHSDYSGAVAAWPSDRPIWPLLPPASARLHFVRFCLNACRAVGACEAKDFFTQLSDRSIPGKRLGLPKSDRERAPLAPRLRLPMSLALGGLGSAFNLVYKGGDPGFVESHLLIDSDEDEIIVPRSDHWLRVCRDGLLVVKYRLIPQEGHPGSPNRAP